MNEILSGKLTEKDIDIYLNNGDESHINKSINKENGKKRKIEIKKVLYKFKFIPY